MFGESANRLFSIFASEGVEAYVVGGAVRDHLLGAKIKDVDFAVSLPPENMSAILETAGIQVIPTGIDHGTITALLDDQSFELTSFRKDIKTDGRHAVTEFGGTLLEDAKRRDFTINALYMNRQGDVVDPLNVRGDLEAGLLRFVGEADARVREDYLRILRFFRFLSQINLKADSYGLEACKKRADQLENISAERIGMEMRKLLGGRYAAKALKLASDAGVLDQVLPHFDQRRFALWMDYLEKNALASDWQVNLALASPHTPREKWRLSNRECKRIALYQEALASTLAPLLLGEAYGMEIGNWVLHYHSAFNGRIITPDDLKALKRGSEAEFPLNGEDMIALGLKGAQIGEMLGTLKEKWRQSSLSLDKAKLIELARSEE